MVRLGIEVIDQINDRGSITWLEQTVSKIKLPRWYKTGTGTEGEGKNDKNVIFNFIWFRFFKFRLKVGSLIKYCSLNPSVQLHCNQLQYCCLFIIMFVIDQNMLN